MIGSELCVQLFEVVGCLARKCWWAPALRGAAVVCWWVGGALKLWVWPIAGGAAVDVFTALLFDALALVEPPAYLLGCRGLLSAGKTLAWAIHPFEGATPGMGRGDFGGMYFGHGHLEGGTSTAELPWLIL